MIVSTDRIDKLCKCKKNRPLITPYDPQDNQNNPARAQLHLGRKCYCSNNPKCVYDLEAAKSVEIAPNTIFLFETYERVNFPRNLSGRMSLKMGLIRQGLLMPNQTMVDPGYSNVLFGMLYNLSSNPIRLTYKQPITTLEVMETEPSLRNYGGKMKAMTFESYVSDRVESSLGYLDCKLQASSKELKMSTKHLKKSVAFWNVLITVLTVIIATVTILVTAIGLREDPDIQILETQLEELQATVKEQQGLLTKSDMQILEIQLGDLQTTIKEQQDLLTKYEERRQQLEEAVSQLEMSVWEMAPQLG